MTTQELLPSIKKWMHAISDASDDEYIQTANACVLDLKNAGVADPDIADPLIQQAIKLYVKAQAGYEENAESFDKAYEHLKAALSIASGYGEDTEDE